MAISGYELIGHFNVFEDRLKALPETRKGSKTQNRAMQAAANSLVQLKDIDFSQVDAKDATAFLDQIQKTETLFTKMIEKGAFNRYFESVFGGSETFASIHFAFNQLKKTLSANNELLMKVVRKAEMQDPEKELSRLRTLGIVTPEIEAKLKYVLGNDSVKLKAMVARILGIHKIFGSTHHVFVHAQMSKWLVYPDLLKELMKKSHPEKDLHEFKFLRLPPEMSPTNETIEYFKSTSDLHDLAVKEELISVDGYFYSYNPNESALSFLSKNSNILKTQKAIQATCEGALHAFYPNMNKADLERYSKKLSSVGQESEIGNLFVFCIPKEISSKVQYRSHTEGIPCRCHPEEEEMDILETLQQGDLNKSNKCPWNAPQFRIFTPELKKENGVKTYLLASDPVQRKEVKKQVRELVQEIHQAAHAAPPEAHAPTPHIDLKTEGGERVVERITTVSQTLRRYGHNVLSFIQSAASFVR